MSQLMPVLQALPVDGLLVWDEAGSFARLAAGLEASTAVQGLEGRSVADLEAAGDPTAEVAQAVRGALSGVASELDWSSGAGAAVRRLRCVPLEEDGRVAGAAVLIPRPAEAEEAPSLRLRLERCERDLQHFAYVASHDLSEPLRVMSGYAGMLERRYEESLDDRGRRYIASIVAGAGHLHELLDALLAYSRARSQPVEIAAVDLDEVLAASRAELADALAERGAELTSDPLPAVAADPRRIGDLLTELIANGVKFSPREPRIHVGARDAGGTWEISVRDEGIGIDPAQHERAFELLQRLNAREEHAGMGAGLTVARETARAHGGDLRVESRPGTGSVFTLTLPKRPAQAAGASR